jgi:antitoxin CcdA
MRMNAPGRPRKAVNLSLDVELVAEAKALDLNLSRTVEEALRQRVRAEKARRWQEENAEAIAFNNAQIEREGLWCDDYRLF